MVVTDNPTKTETWIKDLIMCYRDMLEKEEYDCMLFGEPLNGLALNQDVLKKIYYTNPRKLMD